MKPETAAAHNGVLIDRIPRGRVFRRDTISLKQVEQALDDHDRVMDGSVKGDVLKRDAKTRVSLVPWPDSPDAGPLCVKEYIRPGRMMRLLPAALRHRPAIHAWKVSLALSQRGVPAAELLALVVCKGNRSYIVMRAVAAAVPLDVYVARTLTDDVPTARRRAFIRAAADFLTACYDAGARHEDLKARNVLVREGDGPGWEFFMLDLEAIRLDNGPALKTLVRNLAQLNASTSLNLSWTDRLRFLRHMAQHHDALKHRSTWRDIGRRTLKRTLRWHP